jgi:hypothetical protein
MLYVPRHLSNKLEYKVLSCIFSPTGLESLLRLFLVYCNTKR